MKREKIVTGQRKVLQTIGGLHCVQEEGDLPPTNVGSPYPMHSTKAPYCFRKVTGQLQKTRKDTNPDGRRRFVSVLGLGAIGAFFYSMLVPKSAQAMEVAHASGWTGKKRLSMGVKPHSMAVKREKGI